MTAALMGIAGVMLMIHLAAIGLYLGRISSRKTLFDGIGRPKVTLLRPVCGVDAFDEETLRSSFTQDYSDYEIIFCAQSEGDRAVALVQRLIAEHPQNKARLLIGYDPFTRNPKLNNVYKGWIAAESDWICMTDSNLLLPPDYLTTVVGAWRPNSGLVSCPPIGIRPHGFAGHLECAFLNSNQALLQFGAASIGPAFAQGKTLFFNRPLLEQAGGLSALGITMAEDVAATKVVRALGRDVTLTPMPFAQPIGTRSLAQVWGRQLRWSRVRRDGFPAIFNAEFLNGGLAPILLWVVAVHDHGFGVLAVMAFVAIWYGAEIILARKAGWPMGIKDLGAIVLRDALIPMIWAATFLRRDFEWRGTPMGASPEPLPPQHPSDLALAN